MFNSLKQSRDFDKEGKYIKMWCPELKDVPLQYLHDPWNMPKSLQKSSNVVIGEDYPEPIPCLKYTDPEKAKTQKKEQKAARQGTLDFEKKTTKGTKKAKSARSKSQNDDSD